MICLCAPFIHTWDVSVHQLHLKSISYVNAGSQSDTLHEIENMLSEDELYIVRRGRNAKSGTVPKNADVTEYRQATGFECLLGYLYLTGQEERLFEIMKYVLKVRDLLRFQGFDRQSSLTCTDYVMYNQL